ncbi:hypothetical protein ACKKBF_B39685 [Auxenochlorella protothecoides x Auxenochlorella symbiontica]
MEGRYQGAADQCNWTLQDGMAFSRLSHGSSRAPEEALSPSGLGLLIEIKASLETRSGNTLGGMQGQTFVMFGEAEATLGVI